MRKHLLILMSMLNLSTIMVAQQFGTLKDSRDGKVYKTVKNGNQVWLAQNLNTDRFQNGDIIPEAKTNEEWILAGKNKQPAWSYYNNDPSNGANLGKLYNFFAVIDPRGLAPVGYHVPSEFEWGQLRKHLVSSEGTVKSSIGWDGKYQKTNTSGFTAYPAGRRGKEFFGDINKMTTWWSSTYTKIEAGNPDDPDNFYYGDITATTSELILQDQYFKTPRYYSVIDSKEYLGPGFSVRCIKD